MAALDLFDAYVASLPPKERQAASDMTAARREDLLAARSEEARIRIVNDYIGDVRALLQPVKK
jgi:hypothetical protein